MRIINLLVGENVIRDADTGQMTIYNILDDITAISYPLLIPRICIYILVEKNDGEEDVADVLLNISNNEKKIFSGNLKFAFQGKNKIKSLVRFNGIIVHESGDMILELYDVKKEKLFESRIILSLQQPIPQPANS